MSKKIIAIILVFAFAAGIVPQTFVSADDNDNIIEYAVEGGVIYFDPTTGMITGSPRFGGIPNLVIPDQIDGVPVAGIGKHAFSFGSVAGILVVPEGIVEIETEGILFNWELEAVYLPRSLVKIGEMGVGYEVVMVPHPEFGAAPSNERQIHEGLILYVWKDSKAHDYAVANGLTFVLRDEEDEGDEEEEGEPADPVLQTAIPGEDGELAAYVTEVGVKFDFTKSASKFGYRIYRSTKAGVEGISISDFPVTVGQFVDVNVSSHRTYYYTVRRVIAEAGYDLGKVEIIPEVLGDPSGQIVLTTGKIIDPWRPEDSSLEEYHKNYLLMKIGEPYMQFNGKLVEIDPGRGTTPLIVRERTLVPIRAIIESMGGEVGWDGETQEVTLVAGELAAMDFAVVMTIGKLAITANGEGKTVDVAPQVINERTMLPLRFVSENVGAEIAWIGSTSEIIVVFYTKIPL